MYGRKQFVLASTIVFVPASALCGAAGQIPSPWSGMAQLIVFRGLLGMGAGMIVGLLFTITVSATAIFILGFGMFGVILYVSLFMQGVTGSLG